MYNVSNAGYIKGTVLKRIQHGNEGRSSFSHYLFPPFLSLFHLYFAFPSEAPEERNCTAGTSLLADIKPSHFSSLIHTRHSSTLLSPNQHRSYSQSIAHCQSNHLPFCSTSVLHCKQFENKYSQKLNCVALFPVPTLMFR